MSRDWWDTPPTRIHIRFTADQIHAVTTAWNTPRIQLDDGQTRVTLHPADQAALTELHTLIGILLDQLDTRLHNPWDANCVKNLYGEPTKPDARCPICRAMSGRVV